MGDGSLGPTKKIFTYVIFLLANIIISLHLFTTKLQTAVSLYSIPSQLLQEACSLLQETYPIDIWPITRQAVTGTGNGDRVCFVNLKARQPHRIILRDICVPIVPCGVQSDSSR